jgi:hypothetical protein
MKRAYKYGTGAVIPEGAQYLCTKVEITPKFRWVWHYFLVEVAE